MSDFIKADKEVSETIILITKKARHSIDTTLEEAREKVSKVYEAYQQNTVHVNQVGY